MNIVPIPKKLKDIAAQLRNGDIENGLEKLHSLEGFEPQKAVIRAEISYFSNSCEKAMDEDEFALLHDGEWYAGNILSEHLFAYTHVALQSGAKDRAAAFLQQFLEQKQHMDLPAHQLQTYTYQVTQHLEKLNGEKDLPIDPEPLPFITEGLTEPDFAAQLKKYRPKLSIDSLAGAEYLLHFMFTKGNTDHALAYYEAWANDIRIEDHHLNAARLYRKAGAPGKAAQALRLYAAKAWFPVEFIQVTPMRLWLFEDLYPLLTASFREELLRMPKAVQ